MPMSGSNYVAPTWVDNAPPALDAAELQAMCNTIVQNQRDAEALQQAVQSLTTTVDGKAQMQIVSYVGTETFGTSNPCSIIADFPIKSATFLGYIQNGSNWREISSGSGSVSNVAVSTLRETYTLGFGFRSLSGDNYAKISSDKKTITWYNDTNQTYQLNRRDSQYYFLIRG